MQEFLSARLSSVFLVMSMFWEHLYSIEEASVVFRARAFRDFAAFVGHVKQHIFYVAFETRSDEMYPIPIFARDVVVVYFS